MRANRWVFAADAGPGHLSSGKFGSAGSFRLAQTAEARVFASAIEHARAQLRDHLESAGELRARLVQLGALAGAAAGACACPPVIFDEAVSQQAVRAAFDRDKPGRYTSDDLENSAIYDKFFHVRRVAELGASQFQVQALHTVSGLLADLADSMLDRDEIAALLDAITSMLCAFGISPSSQAVADAPLALAAASPENEPDGARVWYRWVTGHHTFAVFAIFARAAMLEARSAIGSSQPQAAANALQRAAVFLRGTAAAMWYTADFPFKFYQEKMRPAMEAAGSRGGFSGTQNADYERYKFERERTIEALFEAHGDRRSQWPADVYAALAAFHETEVQAAEHHVLVAASKVRVDRSLAQKATEPSGSDSAVEALREIVDAAIADIADRFAPERERDVRVCSASDVPAERPLAVTAEGIPLVICRAYGAFWACAGTCTHAGASSPTVIWPKANWCVRCTAGSSTCERGRRPTVPRTSRCERMPSPSGETISSCGSSSACYTRPMERDRFGVPFEDDLTENRQPGGAAREDEAETNVRSRRGLSGR